MNLSLLLTTASMEFRTYIALSIFVHFLFFASIFDIYFTSPLVHGMKEYKPLAEAPSSRLVLFVADGLRADKFYEMDENGKTRAPFLRNIIESQGMWGVSHTHVPTESRPGHVALIAGFYEDVSAILKGWKQNPIEFDSVFNKSRNTWSWGSIDILPMFAKGAGAHVHIHCYGRDIVSFAGDDSSLLDDWVFDQVSEFFAHAQSNSTLKSMLKEDKIVFFLHLLGIDTNGHSHHPASSQYLSNIQKVDDGVQKVVALFNDFYSNDDKTSFVFTADHGMTDWGSHGAGLPSETLTPLVAWGSGVKKNKFDHSKLDTEAIEITKSWKLDPAGRLDVNQADIAPLMAALVGVPIPVNSVGVLPHQYMSVSMEDKAKLVLMNAQQIAEQFIIKMEITKKRSFFFSSFPYLSASDVIDMTRKSAKLIVDQKYETAIDMSTKLINLSLSGLRYYHTYHRSILSLSVAAGYIGWIFISLSIVLSQVSFVKSQVLKISNIKDRKASTLHRSVFVILIFCVCVLLGLSKVPFSYYLYCLLPLVIWYYIFSKRKLFLVSYSLLKKNFRVQKQLAICLVIGLLGTCCLVFCFFHRSILSFELLVFSVLFVFSNASKVRFFAAGLCLLLSIFPALPVVGRFPNVIAVLSAGVIGTAVCVFSSKKLNHKVLSAMSLLPLAAGIASSATMQLSSTYGKVPSVIHAISWTVLLASWVLPLLVSTKLWYRILSIFACHGATYILISLSYDALFCVCLCVFLALWIKVEFDISESETGSGQESLKNCDLSQYRLSLDSSYQLELSFHTVRRCYMLVFFLVLAFFGVGNIASINSFDNRIVLPFLAMYDQVVMAALLAYKVLLPYLLVCCTFCCIAVATRTHFTQLCCFVLIISDLMSMQFFFMIKDEGSWLDIGTSISHYVISMTMIISVLFFFAVAKFLTSFVLNK